jgi:hypothetical protein
MWMVLEITPVTDEAFNCFDGLFMSVAQYFNCSGCLAFSEEWRFEFDSNNNVRYASLSDRLNIENNILQNLKKYHGIRSIFRTMEDAESTISKIKSDLEQGCPTALQVDKYWLPWSGEDYFMKSHIAMDHFCLAIGSDTATNDLYCMDTLPYNKCATLPRENLSKGCIQYVSFEIIEIQEPSNNWYKIIDNALEGMINKNKNAFTSMREFAHIFRNINIHNEIMKYEYVWEAPIMQKIKNIGNSRRKFAMTLTYLSKLYDIEGLRQISQSFDHCEKKWLTVYRMLLKVSVEEQGSNVIMERIKMKIEEIANLEESLFYKLQEFSKENYF